MPCSKQSLMPSYVSYALIMLIDVGEYLTIVFINFLCTGLNLISPYLISQIIEFIETKDDKKNPPKIESGL